ncbi:MAG TPA: hypothetical protein VFF73_32370 [Planctomycetota bacterium]|nr:hypothetical protein [Planctomycetota bacterium]
MEVLVVGVAVVDEVFEAVEAEEECPPPLDPPEPQPAANATVATTNSDDHFDIRLLLVALPARGELRRA